jgi:hypothetical protein
VVGLAVMLVELAPEPALVVSVAAPVELEFEVAVESGAAGGGGSAGGKESVLPVEPTSGSWSANGT